MQTAVFVMLLFVFFLSFKTVWFKKGKLGNDQEIVQSERNSHSEIRDGENKLTIKYLYTKRTCRKPK